MLTTISVLFHSLINFIVTTVGSLGYTGIVIMMFLESSFFPFPSEVVMPPAGYLASQGEMSLFAVIFFGIAGSILGAIFNYWIAVKWGRPFFEKYGKYFFVSKESLDAAEKFFAKHGHISTLTGRLLPVIRQYISLPAGLARMNMKSFLFFTTLGSGIWVVILTLLGYYLGQNTALIDQNLHTISMWLIAFCVVLILGYIGYQKYKSSKNKKA